MTQYQMQNICAEADVYQLVAKSITATLFYDLVYDIFLLKPWSQTWR